LSERMYSRGKSFPASTKKDLSGGRQKEDRRNERKSLVKHKGFAHLTDAQGGVKSVYVKKHENAEKGRRIAHEVEEECAFSKGHHVRPNGRKDRPGEIWQGK